MIEVAIHVIPSISADDYTWLTIIRGTYSNINDDIRYQIDDNIKRKYIDRE